jgi:hypothetical protein
VKQFDQEKYNELVEQLESARVAVKEFFGTGITMELQLSGGHVRSRTDAIELFEALKAVGAYKQYETCLDEGTHFTGNEYYHRMGMTTRKYGWQSPAISLYFKHTYKRTKDELRAELEKQLALLDAPTHCKYCECTLTKEQRSEQVEFCSKDCAEEWREQQEEADEEEE